jgi:hypothetical protein
LLLATIQYYGRRICVSSVIGCFEKVLDLSVEDQSAKACQLWKVLDFPAEDSQIHVLVNTLEVQVKSKCLKRICLIIDSSWEHLWISVSILVTSLFAVTGMSFSTSYLVPHFFVFYTMMMIDDDVTWRDMVFGCCWVACLEERWFVRLKVLKQPTAHCLRWTQRGLGRSRQYRIIPCRSTFHAVRSEDSSSPCWQFSLPLLAVTSTAWVPREAYHGTPR